MHPLCVHISQRFPQLDEETVPERSTCQRTPNRSQAAIPTQARLKPKPRDTLVNGLPTIPLNLNSELGIPCVNLIWGSCPESYLLARHVDKGQGGWGDLGFVPLGKVKPWCRL